jgi:hypothetical protein
VADQANDNQATSDRRTAALDFLKGDTSTETAEEEVVEQTEEVEELDEEAEESDEETPAGEEEESGEEVAEDELEEEELDPDAEPDEEGEQESEESEENEEQEEAESDEIPEEVAAKVEIIDEITEALDNTAYPISQLDPEGQKVELAARLSDAQHLYQIVDGTGTVDALFDRITHFQGQEVADAVLTKVVEYAKKKGLVEATDDDSLVDPVVEENIRLKKALADRAIAQNNQQVSDQQRQIYNSAVSELRKLSDNESFTDWQFQNVVLPAMIRGVNGNKAILNRIAAGKYVDIVRIFDTVKVELVGRRVAANKKKVVGRKIRDRRVPRTVAGDNRQGNAAAPNYDLKTAEGRKAAAKASLKG